MTRANGRAMVLTRLASDQRVVDANYNQALVLFQYFTLPATQSG